MQQMGAEYPATFTFDPPEKIANWRPLLNALMAIPHFFVLWILGLISEVIGLVSWIVILFTGELPEGLATVQTMYIRYSLRTVTFAAFLREEYPPFTFGLTAADPGDDPRVRVDFAPQLENRNRITCAFRIILVIPQVIVFAVILFVAYVGLIVAFFVVLFTGKWPEGLRDFVIKAFRWGLRVQAYFLLLTDEYPPFAFS